MKKILTRAAVAVATAGLVGSGALFAAAPAEAAPPNLRLNGGVHCNFGLQPGQPWTAGIWNMTRWMTVTADSGTFHNVTLQEINGQSKFARTLSSTRDNVPRSMTIKTVWNGCFPSSIAGYTIGAEQENLLDNFGFWMNVRQQENTSDKAKAGEAQAKAALEQAAG